VIKNRTQLFTSKIFFTAWLYIANKSRAKGLRIGINQSKIRVQHKSWIVEEKMEVKQ
jgi:hypothetical protein